MELKCKVNCLFNDNGDCHAFCPISSTYICPISKKNIMTGESEVKE